MFASITVIANAHERVDVKNCQISSSAGDQFQAIRAVFERASLDKRDAREDSFAFNVSSFLEAARASRLTDKPEIDSALQKLAASISGFLGGRELIVHNGLRGFFSIGCDSYVVGAF